MSDQLKQDNLLSNTQIQQTSSYSGSMEIKGQIDPYLSKIISESCKKNMNSVKK